jgi:hypothetical protein
MRLFRRLAFAAYGLVEVAWGAWAYVTPRHFFDTFPGFGRMWTGAYPPFNRHLVSDLGATFLTLGVLLVVAAVLDDARVSVVVVAGEVLFAALHLLFHATHRGQLGGDYLTSLASLALGVIIPPLLLLTYRRRTA